MTEPTEMELRVSAALDERIEVWFRNKTEAKFDTVDLARTAIRVMREPTPEMTEKSLSAVDDIGRMVTRGYIDELDVTTVYRAMIDAASPSSEVSK